MQHKLCFGCVWLGRFQEYQNLKELAERGAHVAVIGAGFVGVPWHWSKRIWVCQKRNEGHVLVCPPTQLELRTNMDKHGNGSRNGMNMVWTCSCHRLCFMASTGKRWSLQPSWSTTSPPCRSAWLALGKAVCLPCPKWHKTTSNDILISTISRDLNDLILGVVKLENGLAELRGTNGS